MGKRSVFVTKTGVIAATVGSAVGLGNIWRFPYEAGEHGGGAFMLVYVICVFAVGIPVMLAEFVIGRGTHRNSRGAIAMLVPRKSPLRWVPYIGIVAALMIFSFYSVVAGWIMEYLFQSVVALFSATSVTEYSAQFAGFIADPVRTVVWTLVFLVINYFILRRGIEKGIERVSNLLMPALFLLMIIFCVNSLMLPEARRGVEFLFSPDFSQLSGSMIIGAMGQAFFSLSLGLGVLLTYSSYFSDDTPLVRSATITALLDTLVAVMSGLIIFPAIFTYHMHSAAGPTLVFETFPAIFSYMPGGHLWSVAFFILLLFASLTSTISMSENVITYFIEEHHMSRHRATVWNIAVAAVFGVLCALSFGVLAHVRIFGLTFFDLFDYVSSNVLLPIGGMLLSITAGWVIDRKYVVGELTNGGRLRLRMIRPIIFCMKYVAPIVILAIFISGLI